MSTTYFVYTALCLLKTNVLMTSTDTTSGQTRSDKRHYLPLEKSSSISEVGGAMAAPPPAKYNAQISVIYVLQYWVPQSEHLAALAN